LMRMGREVAYTRKGKLIAIAAATTVSIIHKIHMNVHDHGPHDGTQMATQSWMSVAKPMGTVPRKRECTGSRIITVQISGQMVYLSKLKIVKIAKSAVFRTKKIIDRSSSHLACHGRACNSTPQTPVPIVTANHDGVKLRTMCRHPTSYFVFLSSRCGGTVLLLMHFVQNLFQFLEYPGGLKAYHQPRSCR
jgi:hypothetical protein